MTINNANCLYLRICHAAFLWITGLGYISGQECSGVFMFISNSNGREGTTELFTCTLACAWPSGSQIKWYNDDAHVFTYDYDSKQNTAYGNLRGRANGYTSGSTNHFLNISLNINDEGMWQCVLVTSSYSKQSTEVSMDISVIPTSNNIKIEGDKSPLANSQPRYSCEVDRIKPQLMVKWLLDGVEVTVDTPTYSDNIDGTFKLNSSCIIEVGTVKKYELICSIDDPTGGPITNLFDINSKGPATIETMSGSDGEIDSTEIFHITCTASGTDIEIMWFLNETNIQEEYISSAIVNGPFSYGQQIGLQSNISIDFPDEASTCDEIQYYNGDYICHAAAFRDTSDTQLKTFTLKYSPRVFKKGHNIKEVKIGQTAEIRCPVCGYPQIHTYTWTVKSGSKPSGVTGWETDTLTIDTVEDVHFKSEYICSAQNDIGRNNVTVVLAIDEAVDAQNIGAIIGGVLAGVVVCGAAAGGGGYMYYKHKQKRKDEEVAAYAESGNQDGVNDIINSTNGGATAGRTATTSPVYAEVNKDKKKKSKKNNAAPVYSEVDKNKKKKPNSTEHTGPVSSQVNKPGRPLPQLQPKPSNDSSNTGPVYSEVKKPKQGRLTPLEAKHYDNAEQRNDQGGLHYADVDFLRQGNAGIKQSQGTKNPAYEPTEYAQIDHRKSAGIVV